MAIWDLSRFRLLQIGLAVASTLACEERGHEAQEVEEEVEVWNSALQRCRKSVEEMYPGARVETQSTIESESPGRFEVQGYIGFQSSDLILQDWTCTVSRSTLFGDWDAPKLEYAEPRIIASTPAVEVDDRALSANTEVEAVEAKPEREESEPQWIVEYSGHSACPSLDDWKRFTDEMLGKNWAHDLPGSCVRLPKGTSVREIERQEYRDYSFVKVRLSDGRELWLEPANLAKPN